MVGTPQPRGNRPCAAPDGDSTTSVDRYRHDPVAFIDAYVRLNEKGRPWRLSPHQRKVLNLVTRWREGRSDLVRLLLWGEMKKSGKTLLAGALGHTTAPWLEREYDLQFVQKVVAEDDPATPTIGRTSSSCLWPASIRSKGPGRT